MKTPIYSRQFERDVRLCKRRGWDMEKFKDIAKALLSEEPLPEAARPHALSGNYIGYTDCHIGGDWVLIYKPTPPAIIFLRTGTHSDLFG